MSAALIAGGGSGDAGGDGGGWTACWLPGGISVGGVETRRAGPTTWVTTVTSAAAAVFGWKLDVVILEKGFRCGCITLVDDPRTSNGRTADFAMEFDLVVGCG